MLNNNIEHIHWDIKDPAKPIIDEISSKDARSKLMPCSSRIPSTPNIDIVMPSTKRIAIFVPKNSAILNI